MNNGFLLSLGLCRKAGALLRGREETINAVKIKETDTVFISSDISERSKKEVMNSVEENTKIISLNYTKEQLGYAAGVKPMAIFSVKNVGLKEMLLSRLDKNEEADI